MNDITRPGTFEEFVGQDRVKHELSIAVEAATNRGDVPEHVLLSGPPGLGKTTLAGIIAYKASMPVVHVSAPAIARPGDLVSILTGLNVPTVVFVDEIHALERQTEELLHTALEDFRIDIIVGEGSSTRSIRLPLIPFTLVGATTRTGDISGPLLDRFGIVSRLDPYTNTELAKIVLQSAESISVSITEDAADAIAQRSQGTPRLANRWLRRVRDWAQVHQINTVDKATAEEALESFGIDRLGLDPLSRDVLQTIAVQYGGGPAGISAIASAVGENEQTLLSTCEPHLLRAGLLRRTPRGRELTEEGWKHVQSKG